MDDGRVAVRWYRQGPYITLVSLVLLQSTIWITNILLNIYDTVISGLTAKIHITEYNMAAFGDLFWLHINAIFVRKISLSRNCFCNPFAPLWLNRIEIVCFDKKHCLWPGLYRNGNIIWMKFSPLVAPEIVILHWNGNVRHFRIFLLLAAQAIAILFWQLPVHAATKEDFVKMCYSGFINIA